MRTWLYHRDFPLGKIFDTTGETAPRPPQGGGWTDDRSQFQNLTNDEIVEAAVRAELARQGPDRERLDDEHRKKFGDDPHGLATNAEVENVMSNRTPDGRGKITPPKKAHFQRHFRTE